MRWDVIDFGLLFDDVSACAGNFLCIVLPLDVFGCRFSCVRLGFDLLTILWATNYRSLVFTAWKYTFQIISLFFVDRVVLDLFTPLVLRLEYYWIFF